MNQSTTYTAPTGTIKWEPTFNSKAETPMTLTKLHEMLPEDVRGVLTDAQTKGKWLVGDSRIAWQDQMIVGLCAMIAEARTENSNLFVKKPNNL